MTINFTSKVVVNTKGWDKVIRKTETISKVGGGQIGWFPESKYPNGMSVAYVALLNEYGHYTKGKYLGYSPPRPFFRDFLIKHFRTSLFHQIVGNQLKLVFASKITTRQMYRRIGDHLIEVVRKELLNKKSPANTMLTVSLKGFDDPLINTGVMYDKIKYKIQKLEK